MTLLLVIQRLILKITEIHNFLIYHCKVVSNFISVNHQFITQTLSYSTGMSKDYQRANETEMKVDCPVTEIWIASDQKSLKDR